jgi:N-acetylmuramoyl-L-alanine amidase
MEMAPVREPQLAPSRAWRTVLAWLGLLLMTVSFAWWQWSAGSELPVRSTTNEQPFSVVVLDPGHGGQDSGAMCGTVMEKDLTLDIAQRLDRILAMRGLATVLTRVGDSYVSLAERAALTNRVRSCIFVSIHFNEGNKAVSSGVETYYADHQITSGTPLVSWMPFLMRASAQAPNFESQSLAGFIQESLVARTQAVNRGTKAGQFFVIANVQHPAVLVEGGFLSNRDDTNKLGNTDYREQIAAAISDGIIRYRDILKQRQATLAATVGPESE